MLAVKLLKIDKNLCNCVFKYLNKYDRVLVCNAFYIYPVDYKSYDGIAFSNYFAKYGYINLLDYTNSTYEIQTVEIAILYNNLHILEYFYSLNNFVIHVDILEQVICDDYVEIVDYLLHKKIIEYKAQLNLTDVINNCYKNNQIKMLEVLKKYYNIKNRNPIEIKNGRTNGRAKEKTVDQKKKEKP